MEVQGISLNIVIVWCVRIPVYTFSFTDKFNISCAYIESSLYKTFKNHCRFYFVCACHLAS